jgi:hypothetical protein
MDEEDDFHGKAAESLELAKAANTAERKSRMLTLAQAWLHLAERVRRQRQDNRGDGQFYKVAR